jgi:hypothetical protein
VRILSIAFAACAWGFAASGWAQTSSLDDQKEWSGRLLFTANDTRLVIKESAEASSEPESCADVRPLDDTLRERMEQFQNARVTIHEARPVVAESCARAISVPSFHAIEMLSRPEPFAPEDFSDHVPEALIPHAEDMRRFAIKVMERISRGDYQGFRRLQLLDPEAEMLLKRANNDYPKRRFTFISQHAREFFGAAMRSANAQVIARRILGRNSTTTCICRRSTHCTESDGFDAPRLGSWGDAMFCFKIYYDGDEEAESYRHQLWRVADPIFWLN